jgi:hypothetical protein
MPRPTQKQISESRALLENPYAHADGDGSFDAVANPIAASAEQVAANRRLLENQYAHLDGAGRLSAVTPTPPSRTGATTRAKVPADVNNAGYKRIEDAAQKLRETIWYRRHELWPDGVPTDPVEMLDPAIGLRLIDFDYDLAETIGQLSTEYGTFEVAGIIDRPSRRVRISRQLPFKTRKFTAAHELGHAILHEGVLMHRDRSLDGSQQESGIRDKVEIEADKFATFFLMPDKLVKARFRQAFLCDKFVISEATTFALDPSDSFKLLSGKKSLREVARILANATTYNGRHFPSLADQFHVSVAAMAIRLEELGLLAV